VSHDGDSRRNIGGPGILPLRSTHFDTRGDTIEMRTSVLAYEQAETAPPSDGGLSIPALLSVGDINGGMLWRKPLAGGGRDISMWRFIHPCMLGEPDPPPPPKPPNPPGRPGIDVGVGGAPRPPVGGGIEVGGKRKALNPLAPPKQRAGAGQPDGGGAVAEAKPHRHQREPTRVLAPRGNCPPIPDFDWFGVEKVGGAFKYEIDRRLEAKSMFVPQGRLGRQWPLFPKNYLCMAVPSNLEREQQDLVFPVDPRLIAMNAVGSDPQVGSLVCEMKQNNEGEIDDEVCQPLQGWLKVSPGPMDGPCARHFPRGPHPMLVINKSQCEDVLGGWFWDNPSGNDNVPWANPVAGHVSGSFGGLLNTGPPGDFHALGNSEKDGTIRNPMHMNGNAFWIFGAYNYAKDIKDGGKTDGNGTGDGPLKHDHEDEHKIPEKGPERIPVEFVWNTHSDLKHEHPCAPGRPLLNGRHHWTAWIDHGDSYKPPYTPERSPQPPPVIPPGGTRDFDPGGDWPGVGDVPPKPIYPRSPDLFDPGVPSGIPGVRKSRPQIQDKGTLRTPRIFVECMREGAYPGILARPQHFGTNARDFRNWKNPDEAEYHTEKLQKPITARLEAFGAQRDSTWDYTHQPNTTGRYAPLGTADGGFVLLPPEVSLEEARDGTEPGTTSDSSFVMADGTEFGFGKPSTLYGKLGTGYSIRHDPTADHLQIFKVTSTPSARSSSGRFVFGDDLEVQSSGKGIVVTDSGDGNRYRIRTNNGAITVDAL